MQARIASGSRSLVSMIARFAVNLDVMARRVVR
jgi:hypothetical protein